MNTEVLPMTSASNVCRLKRLVKRSAWIIFLALLNSRLAPAQTPSNTSDLGIPTAINSCPMRLDQLRPLRGFKLGMTIPEFTKSFRGSPPQVPERDYLGIRTIKFNWSEERGSSTDIDKIEFRFFSDRLYQMEATYSVRTEWDQRPWSDFAEAISRGMGVKAAWSETSPKQFRLDCGEVRFDLRVMEPLMSRSSLPAGQIASAFLTLTETGSETRIKQQEDAHRRQQPQRDAERRQTFKP
jgi:hypothetical protein